VNNRELWTKANAEYVGERAYEDWPSDSVVWGIFSIPEKVLNVLGDVSGLDVVELGCGTAHFSGWLARLGARPIGIDITPVQLQTALRCQERFKISFPLIEANAECIPLKSDSCDLAVSECGASLWCDPERWVSEASRVLRPGGRLIFHSSSVLAILCLPEGGQTARQLVRGQRDVYRIELDNGAVEFHPSHGDWIRILHASNFEIDTLHELYAPPGAKLHPYYQYTNPEWAARWPAEELWVAHLRDLPAEYSEGLAAAFRCRKAAGPTHEPGIAVRDRVSMWVLMLPYRGRESARRPRRCDSGPPSARAEASLATFPGTTSRVAGPRCPARPMKARFDPWKTRSNR
jgi:SAM-dependent methyltransferase